MREETRRMSDAFSEEGKHELSQCRGRWPHLRRFDENECQARPAGDLAGSVE